MTIANRITFATDHLPTTQDCERRNIDALLRDTGASHYDHQKHMQIRTLLAGRHFSNALEIGCDDGALSRLLAQQCVRLLCCDPSQRNVQLTQRQLAGQKHAHVEKRRLPMQWPEGCFDLIVLNDACSQLDANDTRRLIMRARMALAAHGTLIACHRRAIIDGRNQGGDAIHQHLQSGLSSPRILHYCDADLLVEAWHDGCASTPV